jgi:hypothetical protein
MAWRAESRRRGDNLGLRQQPDGGRGTQRDELGEAHCSRVGVGHAIDDTPAYEVDLAELVFEADKPATCESSTHTSRWPFVIPESAARHSNSMAQYEVVSAAPAVTSEYPPPPLFIACADNQGDVAAASLQPQRHNCELT